MAGTGSSLSLGAKMSSDHQDGPALPVEAWNVYHQLPRSMMADMTFHQIHRHRLETAAGYQGEIDALRDRALTLEVNMLRVVRRLRALEDKHHEKNRLEHQHWYPWLVDALPQVDTEHPAGQGGGDDAA